MTGPAPPRTDDGAAGPASMIITVLVTLVLTGAGVPIVRAAVVAQRLQTAADLTAIAVLTGSRLAGGAGDPDLDRGHAVAAANGARLASIDVAGWPLGVHVQVQLQSRAAGGGDALTATGTAALRPDDVLPDRPPPVAEASGRQR